MNPEYYSRTTYIRGNKKSRDHVQKQQKFHELGSTKLCSLTVRPNISQVLGLVSGSWFWLGYDYW